MVPKSGLSLMRTFKSSELYLALSGTREPFDNHFVSVHTAFVRVRRGSIYRQEVHEEGWRLLNEHVMVRDSRADDPDAELMVSAVVPTFALLMAPPAFTALQLRPRDSAEMFAAPKDILRKMGGQVWKAFYKADLGNKNETAVLAPGGICEARIAHPEKAVTDYPYKHPTQSSPKMGRSSGQAVTMYRFVYGGAAVDQCIELINQSGNRGECRLVYRVTLSMANDEARTLMTRGGAPVVGKSRNPCSVRIMLGERVCHVVGLPFPVKRGTIDLKYSKHQSHVLFTVCPLLAGVLKPTLVWAAYNMQGMGHTILPSTLGWSPCAPLSSLPRLDFKSEWTHPQVHHAGSEIHSKSASHPGVCPWYILRHVLTPGTVCCKVVSLTNRTGLFDLSFRTG